MSLSDKFAIRQVKEGIRWDPETEHSQTPILHTGGRQATADAPSDLDSETMALDRLFHLKRQMMRDLEGRRMMFEIMAKFWDKGRVREMDPMVHNMPTLRYIALLERTSMACIVCQRHWAPCKNADNAHKTLQTA